MSLQGVVHNGGSVGTTVRSTITGTDGCVEQPCILSAKIATLRSDFDDPLDNARYFALDFTDYLDDSFFDNYFGFGGFERRFPFSPSCIDGAVLPLDSQLLLLNHGSVIARIIDGFGARGRGADHQPCKNYVCPNFHDTPLPLPVT